MDSYKELIFLANNVHYVHMKTLLTATQVRQKFFSLLKKAEKDGEVVFVKKGQEGVFKISLVKKGKSSKNLAGLLKKIQSIGIKAPFKEEFDILRSDRYSR